MPPYTGNPHQQWHRDRAHRLDHPLRVDYLQLMVYLTDVDEDTHCFSLSPEAIDQPILKETKAQLRRGIYDLHGPAGTCALCNAAILHTRDHATHPDKERKTVQIYYGHRDRAPLANDSAIPATLWRDHPDAQTRAFYGVLNERTAFCCPRLAHGAQAGRALEESRHIGVDSGTGTSPSRTVVAPRDPGAGHHDEYDRDDRDRILATRLD